LLLLLLTCPSEEGSSTFTLPMSDETTEPAQRCVPGPGAWVDWGGKWGEREGFSVEVEFFFLFDERGEPPIVNRKRKLSFASLSSASLYVLFA